MSIQSSLFLSIQSFIQLIIHLYIYLAFYWSILYSNSLYFQPAICLSILLWSIWIIIFMHPFCQAIFVSIFPASYLPMHQTLTNVFYTQSLIVQSMQLYIYPSNMYLVYTMPTMCLPMYSFISHLSFCLSICPISHYVSTHLVCIDLSIHLLIHLSLN